MEKVEEEENEKECEDPIEDEYGRETKGKE